MRRLHDEALWVAWIYLLKQGHRVAQEVGVPGGRIDIVRLDAENNWVELYEVKLARGDLGVPQILRYGRLVPGAPQLTLIVPPDAVTDSLLSLAEESNVRVWAFDFAAHADQDREYSGEMVHLSSLAEESIERIRRAAMAWAKTPAAKEAQRRSREWCVRRTCRRADGRRADGAPDLEAA